MTLASSDPVFVRLADILSLELELLKSGRAGEVAALIEDKMRALQDFEAKIGSAPLAGVSPQHRTAVERIVRMAEENAAHMDAVRNGVRHAIHRLDSMSNSAHVGSYGRGGSQLSFTNATGAYSRKV